MKQDTWYQTGGDVNPATYGGVFSRFEEDGSLHMVRVAPVREYVGDREAAEMGYPFLWSEVYLDAAEVAETAAKRLKEIFDYGDGVINLHALAAACEWAITEGDGPMSWESCDNGYSFLRWGRDLPYGIGRDIEGLAESLLDADAEFRTDVLGE